MPRNGRNTACERRLIEDYARTHNLPITRPNEHQIKIGDLNFYPSTGTILRDGERQKEPVRGAQALIAIISGDDNSAHEVSL